MDSELTKQYLIKIPTDYRAMIMALVKQFSLINALSLQDNLNVKLES